jgi:hypothetical protein
MVGPQGHSQYHAAVQGLPELLQAAMKSEVLVPGAESVCQPRERGVAHDLTVLHKEPTDLHQVTRIGTVVGNELCHHCDNLAGVNLEIWPRSVELAIVFPESIEATASLVALTAARTLAGLRLRTPAARVRRQGVRHAVGLPDVDFGTATTIPADALLSAPV